MKNREFDRPGVYTNTAIFEIEKRRILKKYSWYAEKRKQCPQIDKHLKNRDYGVVLTAKRNRNDYLEEPLVDTKKQSRDSVSV